MAHWARTVRVLINIAVQMRIRWLTTIDLLNYIELVSSCRLRPWVVNNIAKTQENEACKKEKKSRNKSIQLIPSDVMINHNFLY